MPSNYTPVQQNRQTGAVLDTMTLLDGQIVVEQTQGRYRIRAGDGATVGGIKMARLDEAPGQTLAESAKTSNYNVVNADAGTRVNFNSAAPVSGFLPAITGAPQGLPFRLRNVGNGLLTVAAAGTDTFDDGSAGLILDAGEEAVLWTNGTVWRADRYRAEGNLAPETMLASAATADIGSTNTERVMITGTTAITSLGSRPRKRRLVRFSAALTLTYNSASLILPGAANIVTAPNDIAEFVSDAAGNWRCVFYAAASGAPTAGSLRYDTAQLTTAAQKVQAQANIGALASMMQVGGRLAAGAAGVAVTEQDVVGATVLRLVPSGNDFTLIHDGTTLVPIQYVETTLALDTVGHPAATAFTVFEYMSGGVLALGTGPAWPSPLSPGTGAGTSEVTLFQGRLVNKNPIVLRNAGASSAVIPALQATMRGGFQTTLAGQAEDSAHNRLLSNLYNPVRRPMVLIETAVTWTWSTAAWQQARGQASNQVTYFHCAGGRSLSARVVGYVQNSTSNPQSVQVGIGIDSNADVATQRFCAFADLSYRPTEAYFDGYPGQGAHSVRWLEYGGLADTQTWVGYNSLAFRSGITAWVEN